MLKCMLEPKSITQSMSKINFDFPLKICDDSFIFILKNNLIIIFFNSFPFYKLNKSLNNKIFFLKLQAAICLYLVIFLRLPFMLYVQY